MFRRKDEEHNISDESPMTQAESNQSTLDVAPANSNESVHPIPAAAAPAFRPAPPQAAMAARPAPAAAAAAPAPATPVVSTPNVTKSTKRVLTVGPDIQMKGEITTCDRVVIEGMVDATMKDVHTVELAQSGSLKGTAEVEDAEISGIFEGDLIVRGRLIVYSTGQIRGNVTYGEIEIERGGRISGNIHTVDESASKAAAPSHRRAA